MMTVERSMEIMVKTVSVITAVLLVVNAVNIFVKLAF
jgi:hypothetical protein